MTARPALALLLAAGLFACDDADETPADLGPPDAAADAAPVDAAPDGAPADAAPRDAAPDALPADMGPPPPAPVGYLAESITYAPAAPDGERTLPVFWWYPAAEASGGSVRYRSVFEGVQVFDGAAPAVESPAPLLVFSHGRSGFGQYSFFLTEHFARQGWVVLGVDHIGDTLGDAEDSPPIYRLRPQDLTAVIDHALDPGAGHPLAGRVGGPVVVVGHSFGGYTALAIGGADYDVATFEATCPESDSPFCAGYQQTAELYGMGLGDPRVEALGVLAPGNYTLFRQGLAAIDVPVMLMTAHGDRNNPDEVDGTPVWDDLAPDPRHRRVRFTTGGHFTFTSICLIVGPLGADNGCSADNIPPEQAHPIVNAYLGAFFDRHVLGGADAAGDALLDGEPPYADVLLERKAEE